MSNYVQSIDTVITAHDQYT